MQNLQHPFSYLSAGKYSFFFLTLTDGGGVV